MYRMQNLFKKNNKIAIIALIFSLVSIYLTIYPLPNKPNLVVFNEDIKNNGIMVFIHNGGTSPCVELIIKYPNKFLKVEQILNYKTSNLRNAEYKNGSFIYQPQRFILLNACKDDFCEQKLGYLDVNDILPIRFSFKEQELESYEIKISCSGQEKNLYIRN